MPTGSRRDDLLGAIAVLVLLIGTATGNAYALLAMSVTALILLTAVYRRRAWPDRSWWRLWRLSPLL